MPYSDPNKQRESWRRYYHRNPEAHRARSRDTYHTRKALGICTHCGKADARPNKIKCESCKDR